MKRNLLGIGALAGWLALAGCSAVPANKINIQGPTGTYSIETLKNVCISNFVATVRTNGELEIKFDYWSSTNDPAVISKAAAGQAAVIDAASKLAATVAAQAVKAAMATSQTNK